MGKGDCVEGREGRGGRDKAWEYAVRERSNRALR